MEGENKISERRKFERFGISFKVSMRILGIFSRPLTVNVQTKNISVEGMQIELSKEGEEALDLVAYLALDKKEVALNIEIPPKGELIRAIGRIMWSQSGSKKEPYYFKAGIFLEEIEDRTKWTDFVRNIAEVQERSES